jgi:hypothetical protein
MGNYFPEDIVLEDVQSPTEILADAQKDWEVSGGGVLKLLFQDVKSQSGNDIIIVRAHHIPSNRTGTLFSVVHRPSAGYPVTIIPEEEEKLPDFLRKSYIDNTKPPGIHQAAMIGLSKQHRPAFFPAVTENRWVADVPSEFRTKLQQAFKLSSVKSLILNLVAGGKNSNSVEELPIDQ